MNKTKNYDNLQRFITTSEMAKSVEEILTIPSIYAERANLLLSDFISEYFNLVDGSKVLICDLHAKPDVIQAKLESIAEDIEMCFNMLSECCDYAQ